MAGEQFNPILGGSGNYQVSSATPNYGYTSSLLKGYDPLTLNRLAQSTQVQTAPMLPGIDPTYTQEPGADGSFWGGLKNTVGDEGFMKGAMGIGQLGLGLANYFTMKPVYEEQLKGLKQNRQFAQADQARRDTTRANFDKALG